MVFWIIPPLINLKNPVKVGPPLTKFSGSTHALKGLAIAAVYVHVILDATFKFYVNKDVLFCIWPGGPLHVQ